MKVVNENEFFSYDDTLSQNLNVFHKPSSN